MAAADIGANFDNYQGNPVAGGETAGVLKIDTSPIMQMAQYTVMYNKSVWEQTQKDTDAKIAQLADISTLNPNNAIPKDKDEALAAFNELVKYGSDYAKNTAKTPEEKIQKTLEWQAQLGKAKNIITSANKRALGYNARKIDIENTAGYNGQQKKILMDKLDKDANSTDIYTPISPTATKFDLKVPSIGAPTYAKIDVMQNEPDGNGKKINNHTFFDPDANMNASFLEAQGLKGLQNRKATSDLEQTQFNLENASDNGQQVWSDASNFLNQAISDPKYKNKDGQVDLQTIEANNPLVANIVGLADKWNSYATKVKDDIANGVYTDESGKTLLDTKKYFTIDPTKGISAAQMVFLEKFSKANPDAIDTKYTHTGDATATQKNALDAQKMGETSRHNKVMEGISGKNANANLMRANAQVEHQKLKEKDPQTATAVETVYGGLLNKVVPGVSTTYSIGNKSREVKGVKTEDKFDFIPTNDIPAGWTNINGVVTNEKGKLVVGKLDPFVGDNGQEYLKVKYYNPKNGAVIDGNNDLIKEQYAKAKNSGYGKSIEDFIRTVAKKNPNLIMSEFVGKNGTANINSISQSLKATNASMTSKGEENIFGTEPAPSAETTNNEDNLDQ